METEDFTDKSGFNQSERGSGKLVIKPETNLIRTGRCANGQRVQTAVNVRGTDLGVRAKPILGSAWRDVSQLRSGWICPSTVNVVPGDLVGSSLTPELRQRPGEIRA